MIMWILSWIVVVAIVLVFAFNKENKGDKDERDE